MKKIVVFICIIGLIFIITSCGKKSIESKSDDSLSATDSVLVPIEQARQNVIDKFENEEGVLGTTKYIEDIYKEYSSDDVISNIYFYAISKENYCYYNSTNNSYYLDVAIEYAEKIDPDYSGEMSEEIQNYADSLLSDKRKETYNNAKKEEEKYNNLTNEEKKEICDYIQSRIEHYGNSEKYTDIVWKEAEEKYSLSESHISIIWLQQDSY